MIFIGFAVIAITSVSSVYNYTVAKKHIETEAKLRASGIVSETLNELVSMLGSVKNSTDLLSSVLIGFEGDEAQLAELLKNTVASNNNIYGSAIALSQQWSKEKVGFAPYYYNEDGAWIYTDLASKTFFSSKKRHTGLRKRSGVQASAVSASKIRHT